ncbi:hypothetical protein ACWPKS_04800 [Coraliomargarita sp. W4R72]
MTLHKKSTLFDTKSRKAKSSGFALVIALSLMAFVLLLLLSISTLVQVEMSSADINKSQIEAEQNALLGLQVALGELQLQMGPDQRVSASASLLSSTDSTKQNLTGVWVSDPNGATIGGINHSQGDLVKWLVSDSDDITDNTTASAGDLVQLVGAGSLEDVDNNAIPDTVEDEVVVATSEIETTDASSGNYAWWVGDEGIKASINLADQSQQAGLTPNDSKEASMLTMASFARSDVSAFTGLSSVDLQANGLAEQMQSINDLSLDASAPDIQEVKARFHDLTTVSMGVLSDVKNGGLKRDLSLAFEMSESDFNTSAFGSSGSSTIISPGFGAVQPIFRLPNSTGVDANGPTWHLLRDYYTIYQRMQNPMTDPTFDAQAFVPNRAELGDPNSWHDLAALRYVTDDAMDAASQGDPLRTNGGDLSIPVKASYLPYVQRNLVTMGLQFEDTTPPSGDTSGYSFHDLRLLINPAFVVHNPFNVKVHHDGLASYVDHLRYRIKIESLVDSTYDTNESTSGNWHMMKTEAGTLDPGAVTIYQGVSATTDNAYSQQGLAGSDYWAPAGAGVFTFKIPVAPAGGQNLRVFFQPFGNDRWAYWVYHSISVSDAGDATIPNSMLGKDLRDGVVNLSNYGGHHSDNIYLTYKDWYGEEDIDGREIDTTIYHTTTGLVYPFVNYDNFLKPAAFETTANRFTYPGLTHTNPLAPIMTSRNLFPTSRSTPNYGWPVFAPNWQLNVYTTGLTPGVDLLESSGPNSRNGFWGNSNSSSGGQTNVAMIELPTSPPLSLGQLQHANIGIYAHMPALAIGNSFASPYVPRTETYEIYQNREGNNRIFYDLSYLSNEAIWDRFFFSSYSQPYDPNADAFNGTAGDSFDIAFDQDNYGGNSPLTSLPNSRMHLFSEEETTADVKTKLFDGSGQPRPDAYERSAENLLVKGSFNVNSTSVEAWKTILSAGRNLAVYQSGQTTDTNYTDNTTVLSRLQQPTEDAFDDGNYSDGEAWGGFANLDEGQIDDLANAIVDEIKLRSASLGNHPFLSLASFVNRELSNDDFGLAGLLQAAIDKSDINSSFKQSGVEIDAGDLNSGSAGVFPQTSNIEDGEGNARSTATSATANLSQGDLLQAIGSFINVRSDTFRIRSYGDKRDPITNEIVAKVWCEAIVQRTPEPVYPDASNPSDAAYWEPVANDNFGRAFKVVSFRWLSEDEV